LDSKYWIILPKRTTFISNRQTGALQNTNLKEEPFPFKAEYLHELIWESGTILDGQRKYFLKTSLSLLMI
jgi:hypothetical protein